jgi:hypothetical protein
LHREEGLLLFGWLKIEDERDEGEEKIETDFLFFLLK